MTHVNPIKSSPVSGFNTHDLKWMHLKGRPHFDYPIDYWLAVLGVRPQDGVLDFLGKWEPDAYCHFHRHLGETTSLVLEGEHHVIETTETETRHKIRHPGHYSCQPGGDPHLEYARSEGSLVFFSMQAVDGKLFEVLDKDQNVLTVVTLEDFVAGRLKS